MFERLFRKKNVFSYIPAILIAFCSMTMGINPFSSAIFVVLVEEKIPALITFLITAIIQLVIFGYVEALRYLVFVLIYSLVKAFSKKKEKYNDEDIVELIKNYLPKILISVAISEAFLLITGIEETSNIIAIISYVISITLFSVVFKFAYKYYYALIKETNEPTKFVHVISFVIMAMICISFVKGIVIFGVNLWIAFAFVLLMIVVWKKNIVFGIMAALLVSMNILLCLNASMGIVILALVVGIVAVLLSKAGKKGALIGLVFSFVLLLITLGHNNINDNIAMSERMQSDYYEFLKNSQKILSGDELEKTNEELARIESLEQVREDSQNTLSNAIIKCMIIGFFILCVVPYKYIEYVNRKIPDAPSAESIKNRLFRVNKIYWLNPGTEETKKENEIEEEKQKNKKSKKKK